VRLVVLISGSGKTLQNLINYSRDGRLAAQVVGVISSREHVLGVQKAEAAGLPVCIVKHHPAENFSDRVFETLRTFAPDLVCLAGWLHLLRIPTDFTHRVLNIHPALLPAFGGKGMYGRHVHQAVLESGAKVSGCTVHFADNTYDTGPIILQKVVPVLDDDTPDSLAARVFAAECEAYPEAIRLVGEKQLRIEGRRVIII
jgi:phosphoribosylglycinamide formyltransferase-1